MTARKAAVLGSPVAHSKSPLLHLAAYRALGLADWTYERPSARPMNCRACSEVSAPNGWASQ